MVSACLQAGSIRKDCWEAARKHELGDFRITSSDPEFAWYSEGAIRRGGSVPVRRSQG